MRQNIVKAATEVGIFMLLTLSTAMLAGWKDNDDNGAARLAYYEMCRMKADVGAGTPSPSMLRNIWTILKSPAAAMDTFNNLFDLIYIPYMFDEIETGKYAGWTQWEKRVYRSLPIYRPISNAVDLWEGDNQLFTYFDW